MLPSFVTAQYRKPEEKPKREKPKGEAAPAPLTDDEPEADPNPFQVAVAAEVEQSMKGYRAIRKGDMGRAAALKPEPVAEAAPEAVSEAPPKPKRKRRRATPTPEPVAEAASEAVATGDELYQGHKGPGIGYLKPDLPERRDGDGDTVVAERRPRKADEYETSPLPFPTPKTVTRLPASKSKSKSLIATKPERKRRRIPSFTLQKIEPSKRQKADAAAGDMLKTFVLSEHFMRAVKEFFGEQMGNGHRTTRRKGREATTAAGGLGRRRGGTI